MLIKLQMMLVQTDIQKFIKIINNNLNHQLIEVFTIKDNINNQ